MDQKDRLVVGIDIGGTNFRIGAVNAALETAEFEKLPVREVFHSSDPLEDLAAFLGDYLRREALAGRVEAVSIGFPATLNRERTEVMQAPNVRFMENQPVVRRLGGALGLPVYIERDVSLALYHDMARCGVSSAGIVAGIYFGTGIGNAICIDGELLSGRDGAAGELGHIPVVGCTEVCGCGNVGCMEAVAGGKYLAKLCREVYVDTPIGEIFTAHGEDALLRDFVDRMAVAIATEVNILNPDCVLVGGGVLAMRDFPRTLLVERIHVHARKPYPDRSLRLVFTGDDPEKCVVGAAIHAMRRHGPREA